MKLGEILLASAFAVPDESFSETLSFDARNMSQRGRIDRDEIHDSFADIGAGGNGYGIYTYPVRSIWISFDIDPVTIQSGRNYALDVSLPGRFSADGNRPARLSGSGAAAMYFLADGIKSATQSGAGMLHRQSKIARVVNMAPFGRNCRNSVLFSKTIFSNGKRLKKMDRISASLMFADMHDGSQRVDEFTVRGLGLRFLTAGNFGFESETLNVSHRALSGEYTFSPLKAPLVSSAWTMLGSVAALMGGSWQKPA